MIGWFGLALLVIAASLLMFLPGLLVGYMLRVRGILLWGVAPAVSVGVLAAAAILLGLVGVRWSFLSAGAVVLAVVVVAFGIGRLFVRPEQIAPERRSRALLAAVAIGAVIGIVRLGLMIGAPTNISQTNDAIFHLNVLRFIEETGSASSFTVAEALGSSSFYPAAWHAIASLVAGLPGADSALASNAAALAIAGPVWTVGITAFAWTLSRRPLVAVSAAVMSPALFAFPFLMLDFGILYPYALSVAILPGVLALAVTKLSAAEDAPGSGTWWQYGLLTLAGLAGIALAQPIVLQVWLLAVACLAVGRIAQRWRSLDLRGRALAVLGAVGLVAFLVVVWKVLGDSTSGNQWVPLRTLWWAAAEALVNSPIGGPAAFVVSILSAVGLVYALLRSRQRWLVAFWAVLMLLALIAVSVRNASVRELLLSGWYGDPFRLIALLPLVVIPSAALGLDYLSRRVRAGRDASGGTIGRFAVIILAAILLETAVWSVVDRAFNEDTYAESAKSYLSTDERALLTELPQLVEEDARVLANPSTGAAFGYGLSGIDVYPRTWAMPGDEDFQLLRWELNEASSDSEVCAAVDRLGIDYVLDFGPGEEAPGRWVMPGMTGFERSDGFELVAAEGDASLWRINACAAG